LQNVDFKVAVYIFNSDRVRI